MKDIDSRPRFAVLLAAYNGMEYISEQIQSILLQQGVAVQIFISVDESGDGTEHYLTKLAAEDSRITLLPFGLRFGGAGPNFYRLISDVDFLKFDYLSFSDQDDIWYPTKLLRAYETMRKTNALGYSSGFVAFWPSGKELFVNKAYLQRKYDYLFESAGPGCTYVIAITLANSIQDFIKNADPSLYNIEFHDWLIYAYSRYKGFNWIIDPLPGLRYRQHYSNQLGVNVGWKPFWVRVRRVLSGYGFAQSLLIANLIGASNIQLVQKGLLNGWSGYLLLALKYKDCRRRGAEQIMFLISCILMAMIQLVSGTTRKSCER